MQVIYQLWILIYFSESCFYLFFVTLGLKVENLPLLQSVASGGSAMILFLFLFFLTWFSSVVTMSVQFGGATDLKICLFKHVKHVSLCYLKCVWIEECIQSQLLQSALAFTFLELPCLHLPCTSRQFPSCLRTGREHI